MANILNIDKVEPTDIEIESSIHYKLNRCRYHKVIRLVQQTKYKNNCDRMCGIVENKMFEKKYIHLSSNKEHRVPYWIHPPMQYGF